MSKNRRCSKMGKSARPENAKNNTTMDTYPVGRYDPVQQWEVYKSSILGYIPPKGDLKLTYHLRGEKNEQSVNARASSSWTVM